MLFSEAVRYVPPGRDVPLLVLSVGLSGCLAGCLSVVVWSAAPCMYTHRCTHAQQV